MKKDKTNHLKLLGSNKTEYKYEEPNKSMLETFPNQYPDSDYFIQLESEEFTSLCPKTGQPDFGKVEVRYFPDKKCVETKSLKLYLFAYRGYKSFMETMTNKIFEDLWEVLEPNRLIVAIDYATRGGITLTVVRDEPKEDNEHIP